MVTMPKHPSYSMPNAQRRRPALRITPAPETVEGLERLAEAWGAPGKPLSLSRALDRLVAEALDRTPVKGR